MGNMTIEGRMKKLQDVQRNWMWELWIPSIPMVTNGIMTTMEDLIVRVRSAVIPERGNEELTSEFMGFKQFFAGKPSFGNTFECEIEETQDQIVWRGMNCWQEQIISTNPNSITGGTSTQPLKRDLAKDIFLIMYKYDGTKMNSRVRFYNAWPKNVGQVSLSYSSNESVKFPVTFQFDFWQLETVSA